MQVVMVEVEDALGPYPAVLDQEGATRLYGFNRAAVERIARDSQAPLGMGADIAGESEWLRVADDYAAVCRLEDGPGGERVAPRLSIYPDEDGRYWMPEGVWPWRVVEGSRGQVWWCCASIIGPVCGHMAGL